MFILKRPQKLVFDGVGYAVNFLSSLALCSRTKLLAPEQKIAAASLSNSQLLSSLQYRLFLLLVLPIFAMFADNVEPIQMNTNPPKKPMEVQVGFYLLNLVSVNEKDETFLADIYLKFSWEDPRLKFEGDPESPQIYSEEAARQKLTTIWRPGIEFVNTGLPHITNNIIFIYPDGKIEYMLGVTATFRGSFDYRKFPFDKQNLQIVLSSFSWDEEWLNFVPTQSEIKFLESDTFVERQIVDINVGVTDVKRKWDQNVYSNYVAEIVIKRDPSFYLYQILIPCCIVLLLSYCALYIEPTDFADRLIVGLTSMLVLIATRFAVNMDLPRITYITLIDKIFFLFYICAGFTMLVGLIERVLVDKKVHKVFQIDKLARFLVPLVYLIVFLVFLIIQLY